MLDPVIKSTYRLSWYQSYITSMYRVSQERCQIIWHGGVNYFFPSNIPQIFGTFLLLLYEIPISEGIIVHQIFSNFLIS